MSTTPSVIRLRPVGPVGAAARVAYRAHLGRLDPAARGRRFGAGVSDTGLDKHAAMWSPAQAWALVDHQGLWRGVVEVFDTVAGTAEAALSIEADWRGMGWGRRMLDRACAWCATHGITQVECALASHNPSMRQLAQSRGAVRQAGPWTGWEVWSWSTAAA